MIEPGKNGRRSGSVAKGRCETGCSAKNGRPLVRWILLLTCSGSVSRVFYVGRRLHGWVATHDIMRIVPHDDLTGYLYAWLATPQAKRHIAGHQHGGVVQHITAQQVSESLVPRFSASVEQRINEVVLRALKDRERAIETLAKAWEI